MSVSSNFDSGASYLSSEEDYNEFNLAKENISLPEGGKYVAPSNEMDDLIARAYNDPHNLAEDINTNRKENNLDPIDFGKNPDPVRLMEGGLGKEQGSLGDNPVRVDLYDPKEFGLTEPDGKEQGAGKEFIPKGEAPEDVPKTSGGVSEGKLTKEYPNPEFSAKTGKVSPVENPQEEQSSEGKIAGDITQAKAAQSSTETETTAPASAQSTDKGQEY